jgi:hypothetical protein
MVKKLLNNTEEGLVIKRMLYDVLKPYNQYAVEPVVCLCAHDEYEGALEWINITFQIDALTDIIALKLAEKFGMWVGHISKYEGLDYATNRVGVSMSPINPRTRIYSEAEKLRDAKNLIHHYYV